MRQQETRRMTDASAQGYALLRRWEELAPLDSDHLAVLELAAKQSRARRLPAHLTTQSSAKAISSQTVATSCAEEPEVLATSQAFYQWHANLEELRISEAKQKYEDYATTLSAQLKTCQDATLIIQDTLTALNRTLSLYRDAVGRSRSIRETGERLVAEQEQLSAFAEAIRDRLRHFEELESIAAEFHAVASSLDAADLRSESGPIFRSFLSVLTRLDDCIAYVSSNPQYSEAAVYESRFRQLQTRALGGILHRVRQILSAAVKELSKPMAAQVRLSSEAEETNNYYVKFRALVEEQLQPLFAELATKIGKTEYAKLWEDCQVVFCHSRSGLLSELVRKRVENLRDGSLETLLREGFAYMTNVCRSEVRLFALFFSGGNETPTSLTKMIESFGNVLYERVRPKLISSQSIDELCDCISILTVEIDEGKAESSEEIGQLKSVILRTLADAQERLVYKAQAFVEEKVSRYEPTVQDVNAHCPPSAIEDDADDSARQGRETWYGPLRAALEALDKLRDALEPPVFGGIAHDIVAACSASVSKALAVVTKFRGAAEGQLFAIRHLLILREELVRFQADFSLTVKDLDFSHMKDHMRRVFSGEVSVFQLPARNVAQLVTWTAPRVTDVQVDSKKRLEKLLKECCETLIVIQTKALVEPMLSFLTKASAMRGGSAVRSRPLAEHAFASPERLAELVDRVNDTMATSLPELVSLMRLYLPQESVFATLYKPIKANVIDAHAQIASALERDYSGVDVSAVRLKTNAELIALLDSV